MERVEEGGRIHQVSRSVMVDCVSCTHRFTLVVDTVTTLSSSY